jgi:drug/metabolite transporter (DMT)-like permease
LVRWRTVGRSLAAKLIAVGAVQYGLMYVTYIHAYRFLAAHEVALFTIFTPLYVTLLHDLIRKRFCPGFLLTALLAVLGAGVIVHAAPDLRGAACGFLLMQVSNACFAAGQVVYRAVMGPRGQGRSDAEVFGLLYAGGFGLTTAALGFGGSAVPACLRPAQWLTLAYLGLLPSGLGFFLWNAGARRVNSGMLAVFNNVKIPLGVLCSLLMFGERTSLPHLAAGGGLILFAVLVNKSWARGAGTRAEAG